MLRRGRNGVGADPRLGYLYLAVALAVGLTAVQLLPSLELANLAYCQCSDLAIATKARLWPGYLLSAFTPLLYFRRTHYSWRRRARSWEAPPCSWPAWPWPSPSGGG
jgi:hypothetical protein